MVLEIRELQVGVELCMHGICDIGDLVVVRGIPNIVPLFVLLFGRRRRVRVCTGSVLHVYERPPVRPITMHCEWVADERAAHNMVHGEIESDAVTSSRRNCNGGRHSAPSP